MHAVPACLSSLPPHNRSPSATFLWHLCRPGPGARERGAESLLAAWDLLEGQPPVALARLLPQLDRAGHDERMVTIDVLPVLAWSYRALGQADEAARVIGAAVRRARTRMYQLYLAGALRVQALLALRQGDLAATEHALEKGLSLARAMPFAQGDGRLLTVYGQLHLARGEPAARVRLEAAPGVRSRGVQTASPDRGWVPAAAHKYSFAHQLKYWPAHANSDSGEHTGSRPGRSTGAHGLK